MKNFKYFIDKEDIFNYVGNIWRSDIFKQSHNDPNGYIHCLIKKFSETPRIFFDMHQETMEMVHFSSWFHAIQHRYHYTNDILHDLYYHHEFHHLTTFTYSQDVSWLDWKKKMTANEFWSSLESECMIYFYLPKLRKQSFNETIWVDKFLLDNYYKDLFNKYYKYEDDVARKLKSRIVFYRDQCQFDPKNKLDHQISDYSISSDEFGNIWKENDAWLQVETEMVRYLKLLIINPEQAIKSHIEWLQNLQSLDPYEVAFGNQARKYSEVHRKLFKSAYNPIN